jgi:hypothetical protein
MHYPAVEMDSSLTQHVLAQEVITRDITQYNGVTYQRKAEARREFRDRKIAATSPTLGWGF